MTPQDRQFTFDFSAVVLGLLILALEIAILSATTQPYLYIVGPSGEAYTLDAAGPQPRYGRQCTTDLDCVTHCGQDGSLCSPAGWIAR